MNLRITRGRTYRFQTWTAFIDVRFLSLCSVFPSAYDTILGFFNPVKQSNGHSYPYPSHLSAQLKYVQQRSRVRSFSPLAWKNSRNTWECHISHWVSRGFTYIVENLPGNKSEGRVQSLGLQSEVVEEVGALIWVSAVLHLLHSDGLGAHEADTLTGGVMGRLPLAHQAGDQGEVLRRVTHLTTGQHDQMHQMNRTDLTDELTLRTQMLTHLKM